MSKSTNSKKSNLAFSKKNYVFMFVGLGILFLGFIVMTQDKEQYGFGFLGITLGPILVFIGFLIQIFAVLYKPERGE